MRRRGSADDVAGSILLIAVVLIAIAVVGTCVSHKPRVTLADDHIHLGDKVFVGPGVFDDQGIVTEVRPGNGDGQPPRYMIRVHTSKGDVSNLYFAKELNAP